MDAYGLVGAIAGGLAIAAVGYRWVYNDIQTATDIRQIQATLKKNDLSEMATQLKTLWEVYGLDVLRSRPDLAKHGSPWTLTEAGRELIPLDLRKKIEVIPVPEGWPDTIASEWLIVKTFGLDALCDYASRVQLKLPEAIAILSTHLECYYRNCNLPAKPRC